MTPVGVVGGGIDKGKLELSVTGEGLPVLVYLAGVGDECGRRSGQMRHSEKGLKIRRDGSMRSS